MSLATFEPNPNSENEPWIERPAWQDAKFRIWHLMFFCSCAFGILSKQFPVICYSLLLLLILFYIIFV